MRNVLPPLGKTDKHFATSVIRSIEEASEPLLTEDDVLLLRWDSDAIQELSHKESLWPTAWAHLRPHDDDFPILPASAEQHRAEGTLFHNFLTNRMVIESTTVEGPEEAMPEGVVEEDLDSPERNLRQHPFHHKVQ